MSVHVIRIKGLFVLKLAFCCLLLASVCHADAQGQLRDGQSAPLGQQPPVARLHNANDPRFLQGEAFRLVPRHPDSAMATAHKAMELFRRSGQMNQVVRTQEIIGHAFLAKGLPDSALAVFKDCRDQNIALGDTVQLAASLHLMGLAYDMKSDLRLALEHFLESASLKALRADSRDLALTYTHLGIIFHKMRDLEQAGHYFGEAMAIQERFRRPVEAAASLNNLGLVYHDLGRPDTAVSMFRKASAVNLSAGLRAMAGRNLNNIGMVYAATGQFDSSLVYYRRAEGLAAGVNDVIVHFASAHGLAGIHLGRGDLAKALEYDLKALELARQIRGKIELRDVYASLHRIHEGLGDLRSALEAHRLFKAYDDSLRNTDQQLAVERLAAQYEFDRQKDVMEAAQTARESVLRQQITLQRLLLVGVLALMLLAMYVSWVALRRNRENREMNALLVTRSEEILAQKETLEAQTAALNEMNSLKDRLLSIISHDLRGPLASISTVLNMVREGMLTDEETRQIFVDIGVMADNNTRMLDNLLIWARQQWKGGEATRPETLRLEPVLKSRLSLLETLAKSKDITLKSQTEPEVTVHADPGMLDVVLHNLVSNAIKFSHSGGQVAVTATRDADRTRIQVSDTGIGISAENLGRLFSSEGFTTAGTRNESGTGLGLLVCRDFVAANRGSIAVESTPDVGSTFIIDLPANDFAAN